MLRELFTKIYSRINWKNRSEAMTTALGATLLNKMDYTLNEVDNRIVTLDAVKAEESEVQQMIKGWSMDVKTGIITVTKKNGERTTYDLNVEKIPVSFTLSQQGILTMTTDDGTKFTANIGSLIPILTFIASDTINVSEEGSGINKTYSFSVNEGSIKDKHLQPSYLADITVQAQTASSSANEAQTQSDRAKNEADRAKNEADRAKQEADKAEKVVGFKPSSFLGNETGYIYPNKNGGDANNYKTEYHGFVFNMSNTPANYGFLDVSHFNGAGFTPSSYKPVVLQRFTHWDTGKVYTRIYLEYTNTWTAWKLLLDVPASNPVLPVANGGTGQTTARNAANAFINALEAGSSTPTDPDLFLTQYVGGGSANTTYVRRPMSALWNYIRSKNVYAEGTISSSAKIIFQYSERNSIFALIGVAYQYDTGAGSYRAPFLYLISYSTGTKNSTPWSFVSADAVVAGSAYIDILTYEGADMGGNPVFSITPKNGHTVKYKMYKL